VTFYNKFNTFSIRTIPSGTRMLTKGRLSDNSEGTICRISVGSVNVTIWNFKVLTIKEFIYN